MTNSHNNYFDFLRGLAILMVVGIHTFRGGNFESIQGLFSVSIRQIFNCAVPLFLAISGFFISQKDLRERVQRHAFWLHQIPKVYIPVLVWGIPWLILKVYSHSSIVISIVAWAFCGLSIFYFVALIIQYYLLLPFIQIVITNPVYKISSRRKHVILMALSVIVSFVCILLITWIRYFKGVQLPLIVYAGPFPLWVCFFIMGVIISKTGRDYPIVWIIVLLLISLILEVLETRYLNGVLGSGGYGIKPSSFLFSALTILLLFSRKVENAISGNGLVFRFITWIGTLSFGIYLTHCLWIIALAHFYPISNWLIAWIIVLSLDVMFIMVLKKLIPNKYAIYFGL